MRSHGRIVVVMAAAALAASAAFAQEWIPWPQDTGLAATPRSEMEVVIDNAHMIVSIPSVQPGLRVLASRVDNTSGMKAPDKSQGMVVPLANIETFAQNNPGAGAKMLLPPWGEFSGKPLMIAYYRKDKRLEPCFLDKARKQWIWWNDSKSLGPLSIDVEYRSIDDTHGLIIITKWPQGDPSIGLAIRNN